MRRRFPATVFVLLSLLALPSWATTDLQRELHLLRWFAVPGGSDPARVRRLCVCHGAGEKGSLGRLEYNVYNIVPLKVPLVDCVVSDYDENTEEVIGSFACDDWSVLR